MNLGVTVKLIKNYAMVRETLERMGIRNEKDKKFFPSCYCVEENDSVFKIYHFKEMFIREGKESDYNEIDELRRNTIIHFLEKWGLIEVSYETEEPPPILVQKIDVLNHMNKKDYRICHKYYFKKKII